MNIVIRINEIGDEGADNPKKCITMVDISTILSAPFIVTIVHDSKTKENTISGNIVSKDVARLLVDLYSEEGCVNENELDAAQIDPLIKNVIRDVIRQWRVTK